MRDIFNFKDRTTRNYFVFSVIFGFIGILLYYISPYFTGYLIDTIIAKKNADLVTLWLAGALVFALILHTYMFYFLKYIWQKYGLRLANIVRNDVAEKILHIPIHQYKQYSNSMIFNVLLSDTRTVALVALSYLSSSFLSILRVLTCFVILGFINLKLTLISSLFIPAYLLAMFVNQKRLQTINGQERQAFDSLVFTVDKLIEGKTHINLFRQETYFKQNFRQKLDEWTDRSLKYSFWFSLTKEIPSFLSTIAPFVILGYGSTLVIQDKITIGQLIMFSQYINMIFEPLNNITQSIVEKNSCLPIFQRVKNFLFAAEQTGSLPHAQLGQSLLSIKDYDVYAPNDSLLFSVEDLEITKHGVYMFTGDNGVGKTSLFNFLTAISSPELVKPRSDKAQMFCDESFLADVSYLYQPGFIFEGSIRENITFGQAQNPLLDQLVSVLDLKDLDKVISFNPINLSLGEQQKLFLARIFYQNKDLILLDEPDSNLDLETKERLKEWICQNKSNRTFFIISHNPEFQEIADALVEIKNKQLTLTKTERKHTKNN